MLDGNLSHPFRCWRQNMHPPPPQCPPPTPQGQLFPRAAKETNPPNLDCACPPIAWASKVPRHLPA